MLKTTFLVILFCSISSIKGQDEIIGNIVTNQFQQLLSSVLQLNYLFY